MPCLSTGTAFLVQKCSTVLQRPRRLFGPSRVRRRSDGCTAHMAAQDDDIAQILFTEEDVRARLTEIGKLLATSYRDRKPLVLGVLSGAFIFMADLVRSIQPTPAGLELDFVRASSYLGKNTSTSGAIQPSMSKLPVKGRHVILVEDIVDTGTTAHHLLSALTEAGAASTALVALLDKSRRRTTEVEVLHSGFECPDEFVVGYGLDFDERYRSLPYVGVLKPECYQ